MAYGIEVGEMTETRGLVRPALMELEEIWCERVS
jgi:hypothetical protein